MKKKFQLINIRCAVCGSIEKRVMFKQKYQSVIGFGKINYDHKIVICRKCGLVFANPVPTEGTMSYYYSNYSVYENPQRGGYESMEDKNKWERSVKIVDRMVPKDFRGRVLEIGCATGNGLNHFKSRGWDVYGIDPSSKAGIIAKKLYGIKIITGTFDIKYFKKTKPFDLIILSTVLEHLSAPNEMIKNISRIISDKGLVYIEVPNLLKPYVPMGYFMFEHLHYFTPTTLINLMKQFGFQKKYLQTFDNSSHIAPFHPVIVGIFKKTLYKEKPLIKNDYKNALHTIEKYKKTFSKSVEKAQNKIDFIISKVKKRRLGIWGAGIHTSQLLSMTKFPPDSISFIFDSDPKKHDSEINGIKVISRGISGPFLQKKVDAVLISSKAFENEIYNQIKQYETKEFNIYKLYS